MKIFAKNKNRGMTYIELIVVLGIMATISSVFMFNHAQFQGKLNIRTLANEIALKIVEAQKDSINGRWQTGVASGWRPSYGVYFHTSSPSKFVYFADLNNNGVCASPECVPPVYSVGGEVLSVMNIGKGNTISTLEVFGTGGCPATVSNLTIYFKRPDANPTITSTPALGCNVSFVSINVTSPQGVSSKIKMYSSGRVQID